MKKIIESELISIAHRILKLKDKSDIETLYNESKNVFEKISVLRFYENNKFRLDPSITDQIIESALFSQEETNSKSELLDSSSQHVSSQKLNDQIFDDSMNLDLINELIEDSENTEIISFEDEIRDVAENVIDSVQEKVEFFIEDLEIDAAPIYETKDDLSNETITQESYCNKDFFSSEVYSVEEVNLIVNAGSVPEIELDPIFNIPLEQISFEQISDHSNARVENVIPEEEKFVSFENQHLVDSSENSEMPFHQIPLNRTINDAFSHVITVGLNDRIAFEKNLFDGNSEDLNRVLSQLNTIETFQEAQDFIEDLVKPDFNYWKGKEEYEERFMQLIQKRFL